MSGQVRGVLERAGVNVNSVILPDGERYKSLTVLDTLFTALLKNRIVVIPRWSRSGGVINDITGFAAASYQRAYVSSGASTLTVAG
ncbi:hypothetical protein KCP76_07645 [Salmonella enterica subsp. enterica serovar Weltevreden]|nr:hypothetical protein KCP76_07645 [Salmonella enterica subsp. enterica serovar Weltevreden]